MKILKNRSIKTKLTMLIFIVAFCALIVGSFSIILYNVSSYKMEMVQNTHAIAGLVGNYLVPDLIFKAPDDATQTLSRLSAIHNIDAACVLDSTGNLFAVYQSEGADSIIIPGKSRQFVQVKGNHLHLKSPIIFNEQVLGYIYLRTSVEPLQARIQAQIRIVLLIVSLVLLFSLVLSIILQNIVSRPILTLSDTAARITDLGDYSLRMEPQQQDELGTLYRAFNRMLDQIQKDTQELEKVNRELLQKNEELEDNRRHLQTLMDTIPDTVFLHAEDGRILDTNKTSIGMYGISPEEMRNKPVTTFSAPGYTKQMAMARINEARDRGKADFEWLARRADGSTFPVEVRLRRIDSGNETYILAVVTDIQKRKTAEKALAESEARYRALFEQAPVGVFLFDRSLKLIQYNRVFGEILQSKKAELLNRDLNHLEDQRLLQPLKSVFKSENGFYEGQFSLPANSGNIWITLQTAPLESDTGEVVGGLGILENITERKTMEEELLKARKLESLGVLAGGIAHDFNNILTVILGNISLVKDNLNDQPELTRQLANAEKATMRVKQLTQQLLTFSKGGAPVRKSASISELVEETTRFMLRGSNVKCQFELQPDLWPANMDEGQISQVLQNLIINANQAMPDGGTIIARGENTVLDETNSFGLPAGKYVKISIQDEGIGIPGEHQTKIFDPYFTTKQTGSGLGLATTYAIIKKHEGHIHLESKLGKGTTFSFLLPAAEESVSPQKEETGGADIFHGRALVMDDDEMVREVVGSMLQSLGLEVTFAADGEEAVRLYSNSLKKSDRFDLIIMDLTIPGGLGGREAIALLLEIDPEVNALVSSGYSNDPVMANFREYGFRGLISKPYRLKDVKQVLRKVLTEKV